MSNSQIWDVPTTRDLLTPDPADFEFLKDVGFRYKGDGRSVILSSISVSKAGIFFDDEEMFDYGRSIQTFFDGIKGQSDQNYAKGQIFTNKDFRSYESRFAYKFVTEETYDRFVSKGSFLVSSLNRFRELENQGDPAGDRFEGSSHSAYKVADRQLAISTLSGFDTHILSLAKDLRYAAVMKDKFGSVVLKIRLAPFAKTLARLLGADCPEIRLVRYSDLKLFRSELSLADVAGFPPILTPRLAKALRARGRLPSLFAKPSRFETEREVRIAVPAPCDVPDKIAIADAALLKFVERIAV